MKGQTSATAWLVPAGLVIGALGSWCGIGGGLFAVPLLHFVRGLELKRAVATSLVTVLATTLAASAAELARPEPALSLGLCVPLVLGTLVGAPLGFRVLERIPTAGLRRVLVVVLLFASWRTFAQPASGTPGEDGGALQLLAVGAIGLAGGFVAALIGVGGGLIVVPGLFLLVAGVSFDEARAAGLAAGVFAALRSLALHARAGRVVWREGLALASGGLIGAGAGLLLLDRFGLVQQGRIVLGVLLAAVALRFAFARADAAQA